MDPDFSRFQSHRQYSIGSIQAAYSLPTVLPGDELVLHHCKKIKASPSTLLSIHRRCFRCARRPRRSCRLRTWRRSSRTRPPGCFDFMNSQTGCVFEPLTSILSIMCTPSPWKSNLSTTNFLTSSFDPGSWRPNWLHGKHTICRPWGPNSLAIALISW